MDEDEFLSLRLMQMLFACLAIFAAGILVGLSIDYEPVEVSLELPVSAPSAESPSNETIET
jgi:hypothetical protein